MVKHELEWIVMETFFGFKGGTLHEEVVRFGGEYIELDSWVRRRQYTALKEVLGTGVTVHLQVNMTMVTPIVVNFLSFPSVREEIRTSISFFTFLKNKAFVGISAIYLFRLCFSLIISL